MTQVGRGGVAITALDFTVRFKRDYGKLPRSVSALLDSKLSDLLKNPRPPGLAFEKLQGYRRPLIYTIHITGNYKLSMEIEGHTAILRRVACHDEIDRQP